MLDKFYCKFQKPFIPVRGADQGDADGTPVNSQQEIARALNSLDGLDDEQREILPAMTRSIVTRVFHDPTMFLKEEADTSQLDAARMLFHPCGPEKS